MCGIIAYINNSIDCYNIIYNGLKQLQNRGYDSAGITTIDSSGNFFTTKYASCENNDSLKLLGENSNLHINKKIGIGHTRWSTHGAKTDENSHPHTCMKNIFTIVHNGIIDNYQDLKSLLKKHDYSNFKSQTDSEVIANLLLMYYENNKDNKNIENIIKDVCSKLSGTWGLVILCSKTPNTVYVTRKGSPLLIGKQENETYIVSEISGFCNKINEYFEVNNDDVYKISLNKNNSIDIDTLFGNSEKTNVLENNFNSDLTCEPYYKWMEKEIFEQVDSTLRAISLGGRILSNCDVKLGGLEKYKDELLNINNLLILGCGTSYYASMIGKKYFEDNCNFKIINYYDGCEFTEYMIPIEGKTGIIFLSQSGETRDLIRCIDIGKNYNCFHIGVVNVVDSQIARDVHCGVYLNAGREVAVASTKSFTSQCIILALISIWFSQIQENISIRRTLYIKELRSLSQSIQNILTKKINLLDTWLHDFKNNSSCFLIAKGDLLPITYEGALKIKEITYIHAEGVSASSLKHGPLALIQNNFPVILYVADDANISKMINAYEELIARGAKIFSITNSKIYLNFLKNHSVKFNENNVIYLNNDFKIFINLLMNICTQYLAYRISVFKNIDPDKPRNLAKVVTVE